MVADGSNYTKENLAEIEITFRERARDVTKRGAGGAADTYTRERLESMTEFFEAANSAYGEMSQVSMPVLRRVLGMRGKIRRLLGGITK